MRIFKFPAMAVPVTLAMSLWSTTVLAQATDEGAAKLLAVFQTYLGTTEGVVDVTSDGEVYTVTVDVAPLLAKVATEGLTAAVSPLSLELTDNADGTWAYEMDQPVTVDYAVPGQIAAKSSYGSVVLSGTFDTALGDSSAYSLEISDITSEQTQTDPNMGEISVKSASEGMTVTGTAMAGAEGVDSKFTSTLQAMTYDMTMPGVDGGAPMPISASVAEGSAEGGMTNYKPEAFYGLLAWFVAHPDAALIEADRAGLKAEIEKSLPLFGNFVMNGAYKTVAVTTPIGPIGLDEVGVTVDMNGVVADGKFREALSFKGLTLPEGVVPPFAATLVPTEFSIDMAVSKFDAAAAATLGLGLLDLAPGAETPADFDMNMMAALLPAGAVDITLAPGGATAPAYTLSYEGTMSAGPMSPMPVGTAKVSLIGMDKINEALMASPPEMGLQDMAPMLGMAQMMAKPGDNGALVWEVETGANGSLSVNGQMLMPGQ